MNKFKAGDKVRLIAGRINDDIKSSVLYGHYIGRTLTVHHTHNPASVYVSTYELGGGWVSERFELVSPNVVEGDTKADFVIMLKQTTTDKTTGKKRTEYAPAETPKTYSTERQAMHVAKEMAKKHGGVFVVFAAVAEAATPERPEPTVKKYARV